MKNLFEVTEMKTSYINPIPADQRRRITNSRDAYDTLIDAVFNPGDIDCYESFYILILNKANQVLCSRHISTGGTSGTVVDPKKIFSSALLCGSAAGIVLAHNHPSGNMKPSEADLKLTKQLVEAGKLLEMPCIDHLIVSSSGYFSFADEGIM